MRVFPICIQQCDQDASVMLVQLKVLGLDTSAVR